MKSRQILVIITLIYLGVFALNACKDDKCETTVQRFEVSNFEPINSKSNVFVHETDTAVVALKDYALWLRFEFKKVANYMPASLFPTATACSPADPSFLLPIKEIHFYSFGKNHTYLENQKLDSLFFISGIASQDFNFKNKHFNGFESFPCTIMENRNFSDTLQFRVEIKLENGAVLEQANKPVWLVTL
jgi:hypothetical protein